MPTKTTVALLLLLLWAWERPVAAAVVADSVEPRLESPLTQVTQGERIYVWTKLVNQAKGAVSIYEPTLGWNLFFEHRAPRGDWTACVVTPNPAGFFIGGDPHAVQLPSITVDPGASYGASDFQTLNDVCGTPQAGEHDYRFTYRQLERSDYSGPSKPDLVSNVFHISVKEPEGIARSIFTSVSLQKSMGKRAPDVVDLDNGALEAQAKVHPESIYASRFLLSTNPMGMLRNFREWQTRVFPSMDDPELDQERQTGLLNHIRSIDVFLNANPNYAMNDYLRAQKATDLLVLRKFPEALALLELIKAHNSDPELTKRVEPYAKFARSEVDSSKQQ
jgi:hypothetical protein